MTSYEAAACFVFVVVVVFVLSFLGCFCLYKRAVLRTVDVEIAGLVRPAGLLSHLLFPV